MRREWLPLISIIFIVLLAAQVAAEDTTTPTIEIVSPANNAETYLGSYTFKYKPSDNVGVYRCNLYLNESLVRTSSEISQNAENEFTHSLMLGTYLWSIECLDEAENKQHTANRTIKVREDTSAPNITISSFLEEITADEVTFNFSVNDNGSGIDSCSLLIDGEIVSTSSSIDENKTQHFTHLLGTGTWTWKIRCKDKQGNSKDSVSSQITVISLPKIELVYPADNHETDAKTLMFRYRPQSSKKISRCDLFINNKQNQSHFDIENGAERSFEVKSVSTYLVEWRIECTDEEDYVGKSPTRYVEVMTTGALESGPPGVMLVHPVDTSIVNGSKFSYKASSEILSISLCELYIDDIWNETDPDVAKDVQQEFSYKQLPLGNHSWYVKCVDSRQQSTFSDNATFIIVNKLPAQVEELTFDPDAEPEEEKIRKTTADILGQSKLKRAIKLISFLLIPLVIVTYVLLKELRTTHYGFYSRRG
ncbi:MAG: hypothetical protein ABIF92_03065 [archaeon]